MPNYVVIEKRTGAVFGRPVEAVSPVDAVCRLYRAKGLAVHSFGQVSRSSTNGTFDVYEVAGQLEAVSAEAAQAEGRHTASLIAFSA